LKDDLLKHSVVSKTFKRELSSKLLSENNVSNDNNLLKQEDSKEDLYYVSF
jgi:signal transduction histidine kinase